MHIIELIDLKLLFGESPLPALVSTGERNTLGNMMLKLTCPFGCSQVSYVQSNFTEPSCSGNSRLKTG